MEVVDFIVNYIVSHVWAAVLLAVLYIVYEILIRRLPTDSPYYSIAHILGKFIKLLGNAVVKALGDNLSKELEEVEDEVELIPGAPKKKKRRFKAHK